MKRGNEYQPYKVIHSTEDGTVVSEKQSLNFDVAYHMYSNNIEGAEWVQILKTVAPGLWDEVAVRHYNYAIAKANKGASR